MHTILNKECKDRTKKTCVNPTTKIAGVDREHNDGSTKSIANDATRKSVL